MTLPTTHSILLKPVISLCRSDTQFLDSNLQGVMRDTKIHQDATQEIEGAAHIGCTVCVFILHDNCSTGRRVLVAQD